MTLKEIRPRKALNKAFLKVKPNRDEIEGFKKHLKQLLETTNDKESEEFHKNLVSDFLKDTYYKQNHFINTKGRNDLVIHNGNNVQSTVGVIIEAKKPTNKSEMPTKTNLNVKAFQELVLYYLRERIIHKNLEIKNLIITNVYEWFVFDAQVFDRLFAQNKKLVQSFTDFEAGTLVGSKTDFFYEQIAKPFIEQIKTEIEFTYFDLREYTPLLRGVGGVSEQSNKADDNHLIVLFKLLSPEHLLKLPFANDSNSLDKRFYSELLHIIGLTETKEGGKKLIERHKEGERNSGTILEDAIIQLDSLDKISRLPNPSQFGENFQERLFNVALELSITWVNRILFLKLLEAQLLSYHKNPLSRGAGGVSEYRFLTIEKIRNYDDLNSLFFQVLARKHQDRNNDVKKVFEKVPYLNSSLFEPTELEHTTLFISNLRDEKTIPLHPKTILKNEQGKALTGNLNTLEYLFRFLDAYDFSSEGSEEIQEDNKTLINASVLGLIFEKINGYKDGSFFTPGFITMYMCRETIRKAVLQKFNEAAKNTPLNPLSRGDLKNKESVTPLTKGDLQTGSVSQKREIIPYNPKLKELARELRNNSTKSEIILWKELKGKFEGKYDFHRQKPLDNFIADFFCYELKLVIEIDGETHNWEETQKKDFEKESKLNELGLNVLRFPDSDIFKHLEATLETIRKYIEGFEKGDLSELRYEDTPLNPFTGVIIENNKPLLNNGLQTPLLRGVGGVSSLEEGQEGILFKTLDDVYEQIGDGKLFTKKEANEIVNSIKICDPAVGSGHFLVSALNEIIAIKSELEILQDKNGKRLKNYTVEVVNDELIVTDEDGELFEYKPSFPLSRGAGGVSESQRIQETLFHEKQTIIENCLFGVDINPNSVKICRLRLWIELLKNAYYLHTPNPSQEGSRMELQTLPNIDINIKTGNSLVSRFALDADLSQALKKSKYTIDSYKIAVDTYRNAQNKEQKREMERLISDIKSDFRSEIAKNDPKLAKKRKLEGELFTLMNQTSVFGETEKEKKEKNKKAEKLTQEIQKIEAEIEEIKSNKIFENAFEWRFEFPEVLDNEGNFVGFDVVIGNPPYIRQEDIKILKPYLQSNYQTFVGTADLFVYFIELGLRNLKNKGEFIFIIPNKWMRAGYGKSIRNFVKQYKITSIIDFGDLPVFEEATTYPCILNISKNNSEPSFEAVNVDTLVYPEGLENYLNTKKSQVNISELNEEGWVLSDSKIQNLITKIKNAGTPLSEYVNGKIFYGIKTGYNEAFVIDEETRKQLIIEDSKSEEIIKPFLAGRDIKRYQQPKSNKYLIFTNKGIEIEKYPAILNHLLKFKKELDKKAGGNKWYELQASPAEVDRYLQKKILYQEIATFSSFTFDNENYFINNKVFLLNIENEQLLGFLNSKLNWYYLNRVASKLQGGALAMQSPYVLSIPINTNLMSNDGLKKLVNQILELKAQDPQADTQALEAEIDQMVYALYGLTEEEIKIVEGAS